MVKIGPPGPKVNTLDVDHTIAYADTSNETWQIVNFFLEELRPVDIVGAEPEDRKCPICAEDYTTGFHRAVRLPCNHCFGEKCNTKWLSPFIPWEPNAGLTRRITGHHPGANTCPSCRHVFFPAQEAVDCLPEIDMRIKLWDWAYADAKIALSERQHRARECLVRYIDGYFARGLDEYYPSDAARSVYEPWARYRFVMHADLLRFLSLGPIQTQLKRRLLSIANRLDPHEMSWRRNDQGTLFFHWKGIWEAEEQRDSDENHEEAEAEDELNEEVIEGDNEEAFIEDIIEGDTEEMRFFRAMFR
ncbi:hypothetical protein MMC29_001053 [Sticta canariensis]|nr:hypothetical protein [Sticta canariensis]